MTVTVEVQMERMDSKLEKHIGITETILKNQERTLHEILDVVKDHSEKFVTEEEVKLRLQVAVAEASEKADNQLMEFEQRIDKKYATIGTVVVTVLSLVFGLFTILPLINTGA